MALLRRGSSHISIDNFNSRLAREHAKTGEITASLAWNDKADLDLSAEVTLPNGQVAKIYHQTKINAGGVLDVDMHVHDHELVSEPVENIFWKKAPEGSYKIFALLFKARGRASVPFRALLKRGGEEPLSIEGALQVVKKKVEIFRFQVDGEGNVTMGKPATPGPAPAPAEPASRIAMAPMKATKAKKAVVPLKERINAMTAQVKARLQGQIKRLQNRARRQIKNMTFRMKGADKRRAQKALVKKRTALLKAKASAKAKANAAKVAAKAAAKAKASAKAKAVAEAKAKAVAEAKAKAKAKIPAAMKAMKAMKELTGKAAILEEKKKVLKGDKVKTKYGLKKDDLKVNKKGQVVSAKRSAQGAETKWAKATRLARIEKGITGFRTLKKGGSFYEKVKEIRSSL